MHFNSRPSARGDVGKVLTGVQSVISIHAPPRGATEKQEGLKAFTIFQFTPLREGRLTESTISCATENFNSRPSARGDLNPPPPRAAVPLFQFTPLREGRPCRFACCFLAFCISIHAPPRGATTAADTVVYYSLFQFTPLREGRPSTRRCRRTASYFNSRPSARGDKAPSAPHR